MSLGSIFEKDARPKGRDLHATVTLYRSQLGEPAAVDVPLELDLDGELVTRVIGPGESGPRLQLTLPADLPDGAQLRMRGLGELGQSGRAGDSYLTVRVDETPPTQRSSGLVLSLALLVMVGTIAWAYVR